VSNFILPRSYFPHLTGRVIDCICVFADVSTKAYGAFIYLRSNNDISFESHVAPIKTLTLPRFELMAAVTATKVAKFVQISLSPVDQPIAVHLWTDSQIVLHWLQNGTHSQSFIHQRINETLQHFPATDWSFTSSEDNPADLLT